MAKAGRKSWVEEMQIAQRYSDLSDRYFKVLRQHFDSDDKSDNRWAAERIEKALVKMIPQDITTKGEKISSIEFIVTKNEGSSQSST